MKILGIDTSSKFLCIGLYDSGKIFEYNIDLSRLSSSLIIPAIERVTRALGWEMRQIDYFACGLGPGSFTGIRVGLSTIKGLAWALNKKVIGIPSLDILAANAPAACGLIVPAVDAKRSLVYTSVYRNVSGKTKRISPYKLLSKNDFIKSTKPGSVILGDALQVYEDEFKKGISGAEFLDRDYWYPQARNIVSLALEKISKKETSDAFSVEPVYLYPADCQIKK